MTPDEAALALGMLAVVVGLGGYALHLLREARRLRQA